jgi:hypothetical protein
VFHHSYFDIFCLLGYVNGEIHLFELTKDPSDLRCPTRTCWITFLYFKAYFLSKLYSLRHKQ